VNFDSGIKKEKILCIIDGAHVPAHIKLDISKLDPDVYVGACHKWMCSPKGVSFLYVKKNIQNRIDPLVISWGYDAEEPSHSQFLDYHQWQGTKDLSAYLTIPFTINFLEENKWDLIAKQCREINLWAKDEVNKLLNNKSPASRITTFFPSLFNCLTYVDFLDRPPRGFFFHPQGSS